ncbi:hypothetical protein AgCh_022066 [Apium graveolens]
MKTDSLTLNARFARNKRGIGDVKAKVYRGEANAFIDHLDNLIIVYIVKDTFNGVAPKEKLLYFLEDGRVMKLSEEDLAHNSSKELKYVLYLINGEDDTTTKWVKTLEGAIAGGTKKIGEDKF